MSSKKLQLQHLHTAWNNCQLCPLAKLRAQVVHGDGNPSARLAIIGEAPGEQEDIEGIPFIGPAGIWLNKMLASVNIPRSDVYITNTCSCRPKKEPVGNRAPLVGEIEACRPRLESELNIIAPSIIVLCGNTPYFMATGKRGGVTKEHGKLDQLYAFPNGDEAAVFLTIHPASLLYGTKEQRIIKQDIADQDWSLIAQEHNRLTM
jgi:DNA polymerase